MDILLQWDHSLFHWINQTIYSDAMASFMAVIRNRFLWIPLYVAIITWIITRYDIRKSFFLILYLLSGIVITDYCSSQIFKKYVKRTRPCNEQLIDYQVNVKAPCRYSYSFPSSHAANHFGMATLILGLFKSKKSKWWAPMLYTWATVICFAQIYVGLHYPLDILGGALLGILLMRLYLSFLNKWNVLNLS